MFDEYLFPENFWLITFISGETETMIDYILVNNKYRPSAKDMEIIPDEMIVRQHCLLLMNMVFRKKVRRKVKLRKRLKLWRLTDSQRWKKRLMKECTNKCDGNEDWSGLKEKLLDVAREICVCTKGKPRHFKM